MFDVGAPFALVVVADVEARPTALGIIRCLGRAGIPVAVAAASRTSPSYCSRYAQRRLLCPPLSRTPEAWRDALMRFGESFAERPVLFLSADEHVLAVHCYRDDLSPRFRYPFLDRDVLLACLDKRRTYACCRAAGIEVGRVVTTLDPGHEDDVLQNAALPSVMKPAMWADADAPRPHRDRGFMREFGHKAIVVRTRDDLTRALHRASRLSIPVLLQEHVPGPASAIVHVSLYADRTSTVRGLFVARKTRQFPSEFGNACMVETSPSPEATTLASSLVKTIGFQGIAGAIEFKRHPRTDRLHFIEINPRASASISATAAAGVNLPYLAYLDALGERLPDMTSAARPVRWIEGRNDVRYWLSYRKGDHTGQPLSLRAYLRSLSGRRDFAYWAVDDPGPWAARAIGAPADAARAVAAGRVFGRRDVQ